MIRLTSKSPYERFEDGRPKVPDSVLKRFQGLSAEEVWAVLPGQRIPEPVRGQLADPASRQEAHRTRSDGAVHADARPDVGDAIAADGKAKGLNGGENQWVLDRLQPGDVLVVDLFGKIEGGTIVGDNLFYYT